MYRSLLEATEFRLRPFDIDRMTLNQVKLYFKKPTVSYEEACEKIMRARGLKNGRK